MILTSASVLALTRKRAEMKTSAISRFSADRSGRWSPFHLHSIGVPFYGFAAPKIVSELLWFGGKVPPTGSRFGTLAPQQMALFGT